MRMSPRPGLAALSLVAAVGLSIACAAPVSPPAAVTTPVAPGPANATQAPMARPAGATADLLLARVEDPGPDGSLDQQKLGVLRARPIDPRTLQDIPGFTPLELGHHYKAALAPDRRTLATIVWPSGSSNAGGVLHLVDPVAWTDRVIDAPVDEAAWLGWSPHGTRVIWMRHVGSDPNLSLYAVFAADIAAPAARELARLPTGFQPQEARAVGSRLAVVGSSNDHYLATDDAAVAFVDLSTGATPPLVRLAGTRLGQYSVSETGLYPYRMVLPGLAWDLSRGRLIVVDAERDVVRVVDLNRGTESGPLAIRAHAAAKGPLTQAKMVSTTRKVAVVSADGRWLYVSGLREDVPVQGDSSRLTPLTLQRVDLTDMSATAQVAGGQGLWLSSDGTRLVLGGDAVRLLNASDLQAVAAVEMAPDATVGGERAGIGYLVHASYPDGSTLRAIELATGRIAATRDIARHVADLIPLR